MTNSRFSLTLFFSITRLLSLILMWSCLTLTVSATQKMTVEEVVRKHLESIGATEERASVKSRIVIGTTKFSYRVTKGVGKAEGTAVMASEGDRSLIGMNFPEADYPHERLGFDGKSFTTGFIRTGVRTVLGDFLYSHNDVFKEGLIGGSLTQTWALLNMAERKPKLEYEGTKKINGKETYMLSYGLRKGSDFEIRLYFDSATFQHVRSEYTQVIAPMIGQTVSTLQGRPTENSSRQRSTRYEMVEEFSDFKKESGLTLPHNYKFRLVIDNQGGARQFDWELNLVQYNFNRPIPPDSFNVEAFKEQ
jgi:hypothetical protein